jgi:nicotinamidase-related amidase
MATSTQRDEDREQREQARAEKLEALHQTLTAQVAELVDSEAWQEMLRAAARFHRYSFGNVCMILAQRPTATQVAGFQTWRSLGRSVTKGEKGIAILAPVTYKTKPTAEPHHGPDEPHDEKPDATMGGDMTSAPPTCADQIKNGQEITNKVLQVLEAARGAGIRVFFTRHMSLPKELMGVSQLRTAMAWQRVTSVSEVKPWFLRDAPGFHLIPEMTPLPSEAVFDKIMMSAFEGTPLDIALRDCGIDAFAIVGIAMEIGIEPTVRHGADLGYVPVLVVDACGSGHQDAAARSVASLTFAGDALLTDVEAINAQFRRIPSSVQPD